MLTKPARLFLFGSILFALASPIFGWDEIGHKISSYVAWQRMSPEVRERVIKILLAAPEDSHIGAYYLSYGSRTEETRKREYFMFMSTWADVVRDRAFDVRYKKYHKGNWHYSDTFWKRRGDGSIETLPAPEDGGKALERLVEYDKLIRGAAPDSEKAIAIAWLEHLIGDLHQPLHTSARVTDTEPKGDQGGNFFLLTPQGTPRDKQENLHWFWDSIVVRNEPNTKNECDADYIEPIARDIIKEYPYESMKKDVWAGEFERWIKESLTYAQHDVFSDDLKRFETPSDKYKKKAFKVARLRLAMAGYRMGDLFNQAFSVVPAASPAPSL